MERTQSLQFCSILGPDLLPENQKYCWKLEFSPKLPTSLEISKNESLSSPKNYFILVKLSKKKKIFFGPTLSLNCPLSLLLKAIINSNISYNTTIYLDVKFQLLGICRSRIYPEETTTFLWFRTQLDPFWGVWGQYLQ